VTRLRLFAIPEPYRSMQYFDDEAPLGAVAQFLPAPSRFRLVLRPFSNLDRVTLRYCFAWMPPPVTFVSGGVKMYRNRRFKNVTIKRVSCS
jgi:hypothetical protein